jgi:hypothetical protein
MDGNEKLDAECNRTEGTRDSWIKPEITSFEPVKASEGISYTTSDGLTNQTP